MVVVTATQRTRDVTAIRAEILSGLETDLDAADYRTYQCPNCSELCINPVGSTIERVGVCVDCHAYYLATGTTGRPR